MKKPFIYAIFTIFTGAFIIVWLYIIASNTPHRNSPVVPQNTEPLQKNTPINTAQKTITPTLSHYLIKNSDGKISIFAVYSDGLTKLEKTLDVHPDTLRKIDKSRFDQGIIVKNFEALSHIIEDYVS